MGTGPACGWSSSATVMRTPASRGHRRPDGLRRPDPLGRRQAEALRDHLATSGRVKADVLLASVLPRAIETAEIIAPGLGLEIAGQDCDLCEVHTGEADGVDWAEYDVRYGSFDMEAEPDRVFAPGGDSWNSFHERVQRIARAAGHATTPGRRWWPCATPG